MEDSLKTRQKKAAFTETQKQSIYNIYETYQKDNPKLKKKDWLSYAAKTACVCESSVAKIVRDVGIRGKKAFKKKPHRNMRVWARSGEEVAEIVDRLIKEYEKDDESSGFETMFDDIWKDPSVVKLPSKAWAIHRIPKAPRATDKYNVISIVEMGTTPDDNVFIKKKIVISRGASIEFYLRDDLMDGMFCMPEINSLTDLQDHIKSFHADF